MPTPVPPAIPTASTVTPIGAQNVPSAILIESISGVDPNLVDALRALALEVQNNEVKTNTIQQTLSSLAAKTEGRSSISVDLMLMGG